jgi:prepilin-type N-terminal cleavage/methylation domain-containing protein/prepilin-type processing-associated H-X9-DG protein
MKRAAASFEAKRPHSRTAFTLIELLVVISIIGILIALLLPAVQSAREAALRLQCSNNLRQMALAIANYEVANKSYPPGNITQGACCGTKSGATWTISILPQLEQQALFDRYNFRVFNEDAQNQTFRETFLAAYVCPTDRNTNRLDSPESGPGAGMKYMPGSYRAVSGRTNPATNGYMDNSEAKDVPSHWRGALHHVGTLNFTTEKVKNILDGTSNTLLIGEYTTTTYTSRRTFWAYSYASYNQSSMTMESRTLNTDYQTCIDTPGANGPNPCKRSFGSVHAGKGINFALCDGSVRWVSMRVDLTTLNALSTIAGSEIVSIDSF